ncbi:hypothetical protein ACGFK1_28035 [Mycobacterium sp. NPDC048908]|uniref:hypothetical protein n=1 Tax=Mycobacterium sp. NPDC048908 TaxID=3364292 RepID=UPI003724B7F8
MRRLVVGLTAAAALSACGGTAAVQQNTSTSSVNVRPGVSGPPGLVGFPDFNEFSAANIDQYAGTNPRGGQFITFRTADGLSCFANLYPTKALGGIECDSKNMPGFPADAKGQELRQTTRPGTVLTESVTRAVSNAAFEFRFTRNTVDDSVKALPAGQRLVVNETGCAAGDKLLACVDGDHHGFVVSPTGSWAF